MLIDVYNVDLDFHWISPLANFVLFRTLSPISAQMCSISVLSEQDALQIDPSVRQDISAAGVSLAGGCSICLENNNWQLNSWPEALLKCSDTNILVITATTILIHPSMIADSWKLPRSRLRSRVEVVVQPSTSQCLSSDQAQQSRRKPVRTVAMHYQLQ